MEPYPLCLAGMTLVVVKPDVGVSTREAYAGVRPHVPEVPSRSACGGLWWSGRVW